MNPASFAVALVICLWGCGLVFACDQDEVSDFSDPVSDSVQEDAFLNMTGLVTKYGYPIESHSVQTEDGYILTVYRIPYGRKCGPGGKKVPALLQHGLLSSSIDFLIMGPDTSLGYLLADRCYDVWMGNNRGNGESKRHVSLKPNKKEFWDFSWHEMGLYDLPATIDYILNATGHTSLHYIGHSQGTTQFFVFGSLRPEYHHKIRSMHALSPVAFMKHLSSPIVKGLNKIKGMLLAITRGTGIYELFPKDTILNFLGAGICKNQYPNLQGICCNVLFLLCGFDEAQVNKTMLPAIIGHTPAGTGTGPIVHYAQGIDSGKFRQYDYGALKNLKIYKSIAPPNYAVDKIAVPVALYYGQNDYLAAIRDVNNVARRLPNVIENYLVPFSKFNHLDFIFAADVKQLLYERVIEVLEKL